MSYALAGRKEQASTEFAALCTLAPKYTVSITRRDYSGYFEPQFFDRIVALPSVKWLVSSLGPNSTALRASARAASRSYSVIPRASPSGAKLYAGANSGLSWRTLSSSCHARPLTRTPYHVHRYGR
jgi:hypothetical protein